MSGPDAGAQQAALNRAAEYLQEMLQVMQDSDTCRFRGPPEVSNMGLKAPMPVPSTVSDPCDASVSERTVISVGASNKFSFLSNTTQQCTGDSADHTTVPTPTDCKDLGDTMVAIERITPLERALLDALRDEGLPEKTVQRVLHGTMSRTSTLLECTAGKLDHAVEHGELAQCRETIRQQAEENKHLCSHLETSQAQLRMREGELALLRHCGKECEELRVQLDDALSRLRDRDAELAKERSPTKLGKAPQCYFEPQPRAVIEAIRKSPSPSRRTRQP